MSPRRLAALVAAVLCALVALAGPASATTLPAPAAVQDVQQVQEVQDAGADAATPPAPAPSGSATPLPLDSLVPDVRDGEGGLSDPISLVLLLGSLSLVPGLLIMVTAFTRIVIVLGFVRTALGTQGVPPNQVIIGLSLFLTFFVMAPVFGQVNDTALQPFLDGTITQGQAFDEAMDPIRGFMLKNVREEDLSMFVQLSHKGDPATPEDTPTTTLVPAFVISELRAAFLIGFVVFVPFIVIDLVVSAALSAMGMAMLPPSMISLPFKILLFVAVDGWSLLVQSLVQSFQV